MLSVNVRFARMDPKELASCTSPETTPSETYLLSVLFSSYLTLISSYFRAVMRGQVGSERLSASRGQHRSNLVLLL